MRRHCVSLVAIAVGAGRVSHGDPGEERSVVA
jgi:hypothetical protein